VRSAKNAYMREGIQSDKIDARRLAELRAESFSPGLSRGPALEVEGTVRSYLTFTKNLGRVMSAGEGESSQLGHCLYGYHE